MTWLIWKIRSWFCQHDFVMDERRYEISNTYGEMIKDSIRVSAICKKCSFNRSFWKF